RYVGGGEGVVEGAAYPGLERGGGGDGGQAVGGGSERGLVGHAGGGLGRVFVVEVFDGQRRQAVGDTGVGGFPVGHVLGAVAGDVLGEGVGGGFHSSPGVRGPRPGVSGARRLEAIRLRFLSCAVRWRVWRS